VYVLALALRAGLGEDAAEVPTRTLPNLAVRVAARFDRSLREIMPKAVVACGRSGPAGCRREAQNQNWSSRAARYSS